MKLYKVPGGVWVERRDGFPHGRSQFKRVSGKHYAKGGGWMEENIAFSALPWALEIYLSSDGKCIVKTRAGELLPFHPEHANVCLLPWAASDGSGAISSTKWVRCDDGSWWWRIHV